ncbi:MAG: hypothetical protein KDA80_17700 [Planctomycetaceae bacterium]|nr:hypothetical protein [Planctomycetaceae bacterium]
MLVTGGIEAADPSPQLEAIEEIEVKLTGRLSTFWNEAGLILATVEASGVVVELDPAGCPRITQELLDYIKEQGGGFIAATQADVAGEFSFEKLSQTVRGELLQNGDPNLVGRPPVTDLDSLVPVLKIHSLKITTLPIGRPVPGNNRDRKRVFSTTFHLAKP